MMSPSRAARLVLLTSLVVAGACGNDTRTAPTRPKVADDQHTTVVRFAATTVIRDTLTVSFGATLDFRSTTIATPPDTALIRPVIESLRLAIARGYSSPVALSTDAIRPEVAQRAALSVQDPRFTLGWVHIDWVVLGRTFRASPALCVVPSQHLRPDPQTGIALCEPVARGFQAAKEPLS